MSGKVRIVRVLGNPRKRTKRAVRKKPIARRAVKAKRLRWVIRALVFGPGRRLHAEYWTGKAFSRQKSRAHVYPDARAAAGGWGAARKKLPAGCGCAEVMAS